LLEIDVTELLVMCSNLDVSFESEEHALIAYTSLAVDKELQPDKVRRVMSVSNNKLSVHFEAIEARLLRASFSAFVDVLTLATRTIQEFGQK
jgi:EKC/KEOPS complex subunit PCC1/LAGE3